MYKFEKLTVWREAMSLAGLCYQAGRDLPHFENEALSDQLRRAATSILLNIAEGAGSESDKEFMRFLYVARKSLYEVVALLKFVQNEYKKINVEQSLAQCDQVGRLLNGLIRKLKADG